MKGMLLKEPDFVMKKENEFYLPLVVREHKKQVSWHCTLQSDKYFDTVWYTVYNSK